MPILPCHVNKRYRKAIKNQTIMNNEERHDRYMYNWKVNVMQTYKKEFKHMEFVAFIW